ncbi:MAG: hypothetical protein ACRD3C_18660 [Vicinamibacterales bacterium]
MMRVLVCLVCVLAAAPAGAQTHPCDADPSAVKVSSAVPLHVLFCANPSDDLVRVDVVIDNAPPTPFTTAVAVALSGPNAAGYVHYSAPLGTIAAGEHTLTMMAVNLDEFGVEQQSDPSDPYVFTVLARKPRPNKPKVTQVTR